MHPNKEKWYNSPTNNASVMPLWLTYLKNNKEDIR